MSSDKGTAEATLQLNLKLKWQW